MPVHAPPEGFESRIERALGSFDLPRFAPEVEQQLRAYCDLVVAWNQRVDLTAARDADELVDLLLADALAMTAARRKPINLSKLPSNSVPRSHLPRDSGHTSHEHPLSHSTKLLPVRQRRPASPRWYNCERCWKRKRHVSQTLLTSSWR